MSDPWTGTGLTVTIKIPESARYKADNPWLVFHGTVDGIRADIIEAFAMDETAKMLSLIDLTVEAQRLATAMGNVASGLGGRALPRGGGGSDAFAKAREEQVEEAKPKTILEIIEDQTSVDGLRQLFLDRQSDIEPVPDVYAAWKAKGKALQAAA